MIISSQARCLSVENESSEKQVVLLEPLLVALDTVSDAVSIAFKTATDQVIVYENAAAIQAKAGDTTQVLRGLVRQPANPEPNSDHLIAKVRNKNGQLIGAIAVKPIPPNYTFVKNALSMISHELRTPLTSLVGAIELLYSGDAGRLSADQRKMISAAKQNCELLISLFPGLLADSFGSTAKSNAQRTMSVTTLVGYVVHSLRPLAVLRNVSLRINPSLIPGVVSAVTALEEALSDYVMALIQEFPPKTIIAFSFDERDGYVYCYLQDNRGETHSASSIDFDDFALIETERAPSAGSGDALLKLRQVVEKHGGSMGRFNMPAVCKTVWFRLPTRRSVKARAVK